MYNLVNAFKDAQPGIYVVQRDESDEELKQLIRNSPAGVYVLARWARTAKEWRHFTKEYFLPADASGRIVSKIDCDPVEETKFYTFAPLNQVSAERFTPFIVRDVLGQSYVAQHRGGFANQSFILGTVCEDSGDITWGYPYMPEDSKLFKLEHGVKLTLEY